MANLYQLTNDYREVLDLACDPEVDPQALSDTLEGIEGEITHKVEAVALVIKQLKSDASAIKAEEEALNARRKRCEASADWLEGYLMSNMDTVGMDKLETARAKVSIRFNPPSVKVVDLEILLKSEYIKPRSLKEADLDKTRIKQAIAGGTDVPGAELVRNKSISIK